MDKHKFNCLKWVMEVQAIAQNGLYYTENEFDKERYLRLHEIAAEFAAYYNQRQKEDILPLFALEQGYATPKIDVRAFVLKDNQILMVQERSDGLWTLPGGWIDVGESPAQAAVRETKEETGFDVSVIRLLAFWDKLKHDHPPEWPHAYKCFFLCKLLSGTAKTNLEIANIRFFDIHNLPNLSKPRVTKAQILRLFEHISTSEITLFD